MLNLYRKIINTGTVTLKAEQILDSVPEDNIEIIGGKLKDQIKKLFGRSLAIRQVSAGSCGACEIEINALANPYYMICRDSV